MPLADIGEWLQRALEIIVGREQRLRHVGARARSDGDPTPARAFVDEPCRARRAFAVDDDLRDVVAQFNRQIEMGVDSRFGAEVESRPANFPSLSVKGAHRPRRRRARIRPRELRGQRPRLIVSAGERERAPAVGYDLDRMGDRCEPGRKGACPAELDPVRDPQDVGLRFAGEKPLDRRQRPRAVWRIGNRRQRSQSTLDPGSVEWRDVLAALREGLDRHDSTRPRRRRRPFPREVDSLVPRRRRGKPIVDQNQKRPRSGKRGEAVPQRLGHGENDERPDREPERQDRPGRARRRRLVRIEPDEKPQRREYRSMGSGRREPQQEIEPNEADQRRQNSGGSEGQRQSEHRSGAPQTGAGFGRGEAHAQRQQDLRWRSVGPMDAHAPTRASANPPDRVPMGGKPREIGVAQVLRPWREHG